MSNLYLNTFYIRLTYETIQDLESHRENLLTARDTLKCDFLHQKLDDDIKMITELIIKKSEV